MRSPWKVYGPIIGLLLYTGLAAAGDGVCLLHPPGPPKPGTAWAARPRTACDAGYPFCLSKHAVPSDTGHYDGYRVGGGSAFHGDGPCVDEGTWGWDYTGIGSIVRLGWSHGRRYQGGYGRYQTEGPKPLERIKEHFHGE